MITDIQEKQLGKDSVYREGKLYCKLWDKEISVMLFDEDVTIEYAEKCAEAVNSMPPELVNWEFLPLLFCRFQGAIPGGAMPQPGTAR